MKITINIQNHDYFHAVNVARKRGPRFRIELLVVFVVTMVVSKHFLAEFLSPADVHDAQFICVGGIILAACVFIVYASLRQRWYMRGNGYFNTGEALYELLDNELVIHGTDMTITMPYDRMEIICETEQANVLIYGKLGVVVLPHESNVVDGDAHGFISLLKQYKELPAQVS